MFKAGEFLWISGDCFDTGWIGPPDWPKEAKNVKPFRITGCGRYLCRDGRIAIVMLESIDGWWYGRIDGAGVWWNNFHYIEPSARDLVQRLPDEPQPAKPRQWWINLYGKEVDGYAFPAKRINTGSKCVHVVEASVLRKIADLLVEHNRHIGRRLGDIDAICREVLGNDKG